MSSDFRKTFDELFGAEIESLRKQRDAYDEKYLDPYIESFNDYGYEDDWITYISFKPESSFLGGQIYGMEMCYSLVMKALRGDTDG